LRSLPDLPRRKVFDDLCGGYAKLCSELGLINKYEEKFVPFIENRADDRVIIVDSREKRQLSFPKAIKTKIEGLPFGDYAVAGSLDCVVERKSVNDLIGTISRNEERFRAELVRAKEQSAAVFVVVEENFEKCLHFEKLPYIRRFTKATPSFVWHRIRQIIQDFANVQFVFVAGRIEASRAVLRLLLNGKTLGRYDLQFLYDRSIL